MHHSAVLDRAGKTAVQNQCPKLELKAGQKGRIHFVLDRQLQNTIYQFDHRQGVVQKIDEDSTQLAEALKSPFAGTV